MTNPAPSPATEHRKMAWSAYRPAIKLRMVDPVCGDQQWRSGLLRVGGGAQMGALESTDSNDGAPDQKPEKVTNTSGTSGTFLKYLRGLRGNSTVTENTAYSSARSYLDSWLSGQTASTQPTVSLQID
ncbi:hypothetical protein CRENBAI_018271 [Crenichthys baileyi]|uniref:Uncharacterized protein n=1 Tax=Crenichthys baileyi TaxID=28760 RepID=A0AAV9RXG6_9TELE